ncbi:hypothetical protein HHI36_014600 [Cryptolaemus montrouzieri]|uniref:Uncharacterized protein n=1 Tax=Cryptolaemus montrouzieri TaxID=559131 RepID=A0ABD2N4C4_9CUCU
MDWSEMTNSKEVNRVYGRFLDRIKTLIDKICTFKTIQQHDMKPWITQGIRISARRKNFLYHLKKKGEISIGYYKKNSEILKRVVRAAKLLSSEKYVLESKNQSKATWTLIRQHTQAMKRNTSILEEMDKQLSPEKS